MLVNKITKQVFSNIKKQIIPKPPKLLSGELQIHKFDVQNAQIFDGYTTQQLYGAKIGVKHPPAVQAEMRKDTVAASLLFIIGFGTILHMDNIFRKELEEIKSVEDRKLTRKVSLPN